MEEALCQDTGPACPARAIDRHFQLLLWCLLRLSQPGPADQSPPLCALSTLSRPRQPAQSSCPAFDVTERPSADSLSTCLDSTLTCPSPSIPSPPPTSPCLPRNPTFHPVSSALITAPIRRWSLSALQKPITQSFQLSQSILLNRKWSEQYFDPHEVSFNCFDPILVLQFDVDSTFSSELVACRSETLAQLAEFSPRVLRAWLHCTPWLTLPRTRTCT